MKRALIGLTVFVGLATSSCALSMLASTVPMDLIREDVVCPTNSREKARSFQVLSKQRWSEGIVVLYSAVCPSGDIRNATEKIFGHKLLKRNGLGWQVSGSDSYISLNPSSQVKPKKLLEYDISKRSEAPKDKAQASADPLKNDYTVVYGRILEPKVAIVEATFNNGQILRDRVYNNAFSLVASGATGVCELRVFGSDNQILSQEDLLIPNKTGQRGQVQRGESCLPVSHQL